MTLEIIAVSLMAENVQAAHKAITLELGRRCEVVLHFVEEAGWAERQHMLDTGAAQLGFICGLPYVQRFATAEPAFTLLAAPVLQGARYGGRPIYFSDVVVRRDSPYRSFADLRGARWAYNEPGSMSGYLITCYHLVRLGETGGYFGQTVESGAHLESLRLLLAGTVDATALDSTVLDLELARHPELASQLRVVESLGPSSIPPLVVANTIARDLLGRLRTAALGLHEDAAGRAALNLGLIARLVKVDDADYDDIRRKTRSAAGVRL